MEPGVGPPAQLRPFDSTSVSPLPECPQLACERDTGSQGAAEGTGRRQGGCCCLTARSPPKLFGLNSSAPPGKGGLRLGALTSSPCKCPLFLPSHTPSCFPSVKPGLVYVGRTHNMCGAARTARTWAGFPHMPLAVAGTPSLPQPQQLHRVGREEPGGVQAMHGPRGRVSSQAAAWAAPRPARRGGPARRAVSWTPGPPRRKGHCELRGDSTVTPLWTAKGPSEKGETLTRTFKEAKGLFHPSLWSVNTN